MARTGRKPSIGRKLLLVLGATAALVALAGAATAWIAAHPPEARFCQLAGANDPVGAATPEAARIRWAAEVHLAGIDVDHPDEVHRSEGEVTAIYLLEGAERSIVPGRTAYRQLVTRRDHGVWHVVDANRCERGRA